MRSESIVYFLRQTESLRLDPMIVLTSECLELPGGDECCPIAQRNRRSAVEGARITDLTLIVYPLHGCRNSVPSCLWFAGKLPPFALLEHRRNRVVIHGFSEVSYAAG
jgi:hypothetical protein